MDNIQLIYGNKITNILGGKNGRSKKKNRRIN